MIPSETGGVSFMQVCRQVSHSGSFLGVKCRQAYVILVLLILQLLWPATGFAAVRTWDNGSGNGNWGTAANWSDDTLPTTEDTALFTSTSTANCSINTPVNVDRIEIRSGYTGTITQGHGHNVMANSFTQSGGTFNGGANPITVKGNFTLSGATFRSTSHVLTVTGAMTVRGRDFRGGTGTVLLHPKAAQSLRAEGTTFRNLILNDGLVGYWKFDETAGTVASDSSGFSHSGSLTGGASISTTTPTATRFRNSRSISFDGTNDYVNVLHQNDLTIRGDITIAAWVKKGTSSFSGPMLNKGDRNTQFDYEFYFNASDDKLYFYSDATTPTFVLSRTALTSTTQWYHVAVVREGSTVTFYVNGSSNGGGTLTGAFPANSNPVQIGTDGSNYFNGNIDDVRLYKRALSQAEIAALAAGNQPATSATTTTLASSLNGSGTLTLAAGTLDVSTSNYPLRWSGSLLNLGGIFTPRKGTVNLVGPTPWAELQSGGQAFHNLTVNGAGRVSLRDPLTVSGSLTLTAGTLDNSGSYALRAGTVTQTLGAFMKRAGTLVLDSTGNQTLTLTSPIMHVRVEDPTESDLLAYWKFDEGQGSTVRDSSGQLNTATRSGTGAIWVNSGSLASLLPLHNPHATAFNASNDYWALNSSVFNPRTQSVTIAGWVKVTNANYGIYPLSADEGNPNVTLQISTDQKAYFTVRDNDAQTAEPSSTTTLAVGTWYHLAATWDVSAKTATVYINGLLEGSVTNSSITVSTLPSSIVAVGASTRGGSPFGYGSGQIDDLRIYNRVLTAREISNLAQGRYVSGSNGTATYTLGGNLSVSGALAIDSGNLSTSASQLIVTDAFTHYRGNGTFTGGSALQTFRGGLTESGAVFTAAAGTVTVTGNLTINSGSFTAPSGTLNVSGNWSKKGGTFTANGGTVTLNGTNQTMTGSTTFYNLTKSITSAATLTLAATTTQTITNLFTLTGVASNLLSLRSSTTGVQAKLDAQSTRSLAYLDVKDNNNINTTAMDCSTGCQDSGNNTNWSFGSTSTTSTSTAGTVTGDGGGGHRTPGTSTGSSVMTGQTAAETSAIIRTALREGALCAASGSPEEPPLKNGFLIMNITGASVMFHDVPLGTWFARAVRTLMERNIASGYVDEHGIPMGLFGPGRETTYAEALKMILGIAGTRLPEQWEPPHMRSARGHWAGRFIALAEQLQLSIFQPDFDLNDPISRGTVIRTLLEVLDIPLQREGSPEFSDLPVDHPHGPAIATAALLCIIRGDADTRGMRTGKVRPDDSINRAELAEILMRIVNLNPER